MSAGSILIKIAASNGFICPFDTHGDLIQYNLFVNEPFLLTPWQFLTTWNQSSPCSDDDPLKDIVRSSYSRSQLFELQVDAALGALGRRDEIIAAPVQRE